MKVSFKNNLIDNFYKPKQNNGLFTEFNKTYTITNTPIDKTQKADTFEPAKHLSKKAKIAIGIGIAAATIAVGAGIIYGIKNGKFLGVEKAQKYAQKVQDQAEKIKEEVTALYKNGGKVDGKTVARIIKQNGSNVMREMAPDGTLLRESKFFGSMFSEDKISTRMLSEVKISTKKGKDVYHFINDKLFIYTKGYKELADGRWKFAKELRFNNSKLSEFFYAKDFISIPGSRYIGIASKYIGFINGKFRIGKGTLKGSLLE